MSTTVAKLRFERSGYFFIGLLALAFLGFWKSYFQQFFSGPRSFNFYFHFHTAMMLTWVALLISQPILIRKKKTRLHRRIGKVTYVVMPVLLLSVFLIMNYKLKQVPEDQLRFTMVIFPLRDILLLITFFSIAVIYRRNMQVHARAMIITGIVFIEPALYRFLNGTAFEKGNPWAGYLVVFFIISLFLTLIFLERKQKSARWIFPSVLALFLLVYYVVFFNVDTSSVDPIARWLARLPLT